jgi:hypothetical protein
MASPTERTDSTGGSSDHYRDRPHEQALVDGLSLRIIARGLHTEPALSVCSNRPSFDCSSALFDECSGVDIDARCACTFFGFDALQHAVHGHTAHLIALSIPNARSKHDVEAPRRPRWRYWQGNGDPRLPWTATKGGYG